MTAKSQITGSIAHAKWLDTVEVMGLTPNTVHRYNGVILQWLKETGYAEKSIKPVTERDVYEFVNPKDSKLKRSTRANRLSALQCFFKVCSRFAYTVGDPSCLVEVNFARMTFAEKEPKVRLPFTPLELSLLSKIDDPFWRTAIVLGQEYGLRISDVAQLEWVQLQAERIVVWTEKNRKRLELPLSETVRKTLLNLEPNSSEFVFPEQRQMIKSPNDRAKLSVYFSRQMQRVGVTGKSFHCLRHNFGSSQNAVGVPIDVIRERMGHSSVETTQGYIHAG